MEQARRLHHERGGTQRLFGECSYAAESWKGHLRRVIVKAEVVDAPGAEPCDNPRFVVTNERPKPERVYDQYRGCGDCENRIKELHHGLEIDRTSCASFVANAFRVLLTAAAYMLIQALRDRITDSDLGSAPVWTLRERLFKVAARVSITCRRIWIALPETFPFVDVFRQVACSLGAISVPAT